MPRSRSSSRPRSPQPRAAAVAAIIDKRLAGLDRAKTFVDWDKAKAFAADITATLATITGELASADPDAAVDRLIRFLSTADRVFERIDDFERPSAERLSCGRRCSARSCRAVRGS